MKPDSSRTSQRKADHIDINLQKDVSSRLTSGFETLHFVHQALPEINYALLKTHISFLGKILKAPFLISAMTGGTETARLLNLRLATAAEEFGIAMGLGSMRILLEYPELLPTFQVRSVAPNILLFGNLGAVQLNEGVTPENCQYLVDCVEADALVLHLNPLQELLQPEGDKDWSSLLRSLEKVVRTLCVPVIVKEVGYGLSRRSLLSLKEVGVSGLDVAGAGGTSWSQVESYRTSSSLEKRLAESFQGWGIPTLTTLQWAKQIIPDLPLIASGGIRSGIDAAKALHLGAHLCGIAHPFLKTAHLSQDALCEEITFFIEQLKIVLMCTASPSVQDLPQADVIWKNQKETLRMT